jgi:SAM-dependent methyltransferase
MHPAARDWVIRHVLHHPPRPPCWRRVVEFGSLDINGSLRFLFGGTDYLGIDRQAGPGVDVVADAAVWRTDDPVDVVLCTEVLEHAENAEGIVESAWLALKPGGLFFVTCATDGREPHSAVDGGELRDGEWYRNIPAAELEGWLDNLFAESAVEVNAAAGDVYGWGVK